MAERGDSERFGLTPPQNNGARQKDSYYPLGDDTTSMLKETEAKYKRVKSDFLRIARDRRRQSELLRSDSSRSPSPTYHRSSKRSKNLPKFKIANFYARVAWIAKPVLMSLRHLPCKSTSRF